MYSRFTDDARKVMQSSNQLATSFGHKYISTAHILLALVRGRHAVGWHALKSLGVDMGELEKETDLTIKEAENNEDLEALSDPPRAKRLIECAMEQSTDMGHNYIGAEHLLLGILDEGEGVAAQLLKRRKLDLSTTKEAVKKLLG